MKLKSLKMSGVIFLAIAGITFIYYNYAVLPSNSNAEATRRTSQEPTTITSSVEISTHSTIPVEKSREKASMGVQAELTRKQKFEVLAISGDPADNFKAYVILNECTMSRDEKQRTLMTRPADLDNRQKSLIQSAGIDSAIATSCGDLDIADFARRLPLLEKAAEAGIEMAAIRLTTEGPWGDPSALTSRGNDPLVIEWRARMESLIRRAAEKGDLMAIFSLSEQYSTGIGVAAKIDNELALTYATAFHTIYEAKHGRPAEGKFITIKHLRQRLETETANRAQDAGLRLAQKIRGEK